MVTLNLAYTAPVNPSGATPVLTPSQVWVGLQRKVRKAHEFVPVIESCTVLAEETSSSDNLSVLREVRFVAGARSGTANGGGGGGDNSTNGNLVRETCVHYPPCRVDFEQNADGSTISNIVSKGPDGELLMTYAFEWRHPDVREGSEEAKVLEEKSWKIAKLAVESSIDTIRRLVSNGEIQ
ncbi:hypothetical protein AAE478_009446 [Parahypoxylon ruwenzoriense]